MATEIYSFLASWGSQHRAYELSPFGPGPVRFSRELTVGSTGDASRYNRAKAVVGGLMRLFHDEGVWTSAVLLPGPAARADFAKAFDGQELVFVYRYLRRLRFTSLNRFVHLAGGEEFSELSDLGWSIRGWPQQTTGVGFEVHTVPADLLKGIETPVPVGEEISTRYDPSDEAMKINRAEIAWLSLVTLINGDSGTLLDPAVFYATVRAKTAEFTLHQEANEEFLSALTHRILIDIRDEHDQRYASRAVKFDCQSASLSWQGMRQIGVDTQGTVVAWTDRSGTYATELESGEGLPVRIQYDEWVRVWYGAASATNVTYAEDRIDASFGDGSRLTIAFGIHPELGMLAPWLHFHGYVIDAGGAERVIRGRLVERKDPPVPVQCTINDEELQFSLAPNSKQSYPPGPVKATLQAPAHWRLQSINLAEWVADGCEYLRGNDVTPLLSGRAAFTEMAAAMRTITEPGHFAVLVGWNLDVDVQLVEDDATSTFLELAKSARAHRGPGAEYNVLVLLAFTTVFDVPRIVQMEKLLEAGVFCAYAPGPTNVEADPGTFLHRIPLTHHQKLLLVHGKDGTVAFCGGIDIFPDRVTPGYHDVHAKIKGPAVQRIWKVISDRWSLLPKIITRLSTLALMTTPALPTIPEKKPSEEPSEKPIGTHSVAVTNTYAPKAKYSFAPKGELSTLVTLWRAIRNARRYIYFEDQFATAYAGHQPFDPKSDNDTVGIMSLLADALKRIDFLLAFITPDLGLPWGIQVAYRRTRFLRDLQKLYPGKVHIFGLTAPSGTPIVHSKTWIIDDVYVKIGSSNLNRRSMTFDSETDIHVIDGALSNGVREFARNYRMRLWGQHLGTPAGEHWALSDPKLALQRWYLPWREGKVALYDTFPEHPEGISHYPESVITLNPGYAMFLNLLRQGAELFWDGTDREGRDLSSKNIKDIIEKELGPGGLPPPLGPL